jgi:hypothetical protein
MEAKKQREPLTVAPGLAVVLVKAGQINPRVVACGLTEEEAARKVAVQDGQQRFIIDGFDLFSHSIDYSSRPYRTCCGFVNIV